MQVFYKHQKVFRKFTKSRKHLNWKPSLSKLSQLSLNWPNNLFSSFNNLCCGNMLDAPMTLRAKERPLHSSTTNLTTYCNSSRGKFNNPLGNTCTKNSLQLSSNERTFMFTLPSSIILDFFHTCWFLVVTKVTFPWPFAKSSCSKPPSFQTSFRTRNTLLLENSL